MNSILLRDEIVARLRDNGLSAWKCHVGPALFVGTRLPAGGLCLIEIAGTPLDECQACWKNRVVEDGVLYVKAASIADVSTLLAQRPPWMLSPEEADDAIESLPDNVLHPPF